MTFSFINCDFTYKAFLIFVLFVYIWIGSVIVGSLEQIFQKEGLRGMYRGLAPTALALLPNWAVSYSDLFTLFVMILTDWAMRKSSLFV